jgi:hypothetical protein
MEHARQPVAQHLIAFDILDRSVKVCMEYIVYDIKTISGRVVVKRLSTSVLPFPEYHPIWAPSTTFLGV